LDENGVGEHKRETDAWKYLFRKVKKVDIGRN
jgi:hypothetical protein